MGSFVEEITDDSILTFNSLTFKEHGVSSWKMQEKLCIAYTCVLTQNCATNNKL